MSSDQNTSIQRCLDLLRASDPSARAELLALCRERLLHMTRSMFHQFPDLRRWEQTDDVFQNVCIRLQASLSAAVVDTPVEFLRLAAAPIRPELIDLSHPYFGRDGRGKNSLTPVGMPA